MLLSNCDYTMTLNMDPIPFDLGLSDKSFHEKAGSCQVGFVVVFGPRVVFLRTEPPLSPSFHPHSLVSDIRSVQVGCSRFRRCCYL
jgi:hypothetical protein